MAKNKRENKPIAAPEARAVLMKLRGSAHETIRAHLRGKAKRVSASVGWQYSLSGYVDQALAALDAGDADKAIVFAMAAADTRGSHQMDRLTRPYVNHSLQSRKGLPTARAAKALKQEQERLQIEKAAEKAVKNRMDVNNKETLHSARHYVADNSLKDLPTLCKKLRKDGQPLSFDQVKRATPDLKPRKKIKK